MGEAWARISSPARTPPREGLTSVFKEPAPPVHPQCKCSQGHAQLSTRTGDAGGRSSLFEEKAMTLG